MALAPLVQRGALVKRCCVSDVHASADELAVSGIQVADMPQPAQVLAGSGGKFKFGAVDRAATGVLEVSEEDCP